MRQTPIFRTEDLVPCDHLYIDFYTIIYSSMMKYNKSKALPVLEDPNTWEDLIKLILKGLDLVVQTVKPNQLLYIALDGVSPLAKQVKSRQENFYDDKMQQKEYEKLK